ncbi:hypothetical protein D3C73_1552910 [compost metagenome]
MEIHNGQCGAEEQQQPYERKPETGGLPPRIRLVYFHNRPSFSNRLDIRFRREFLHMRNDLQHVDQDEIPILFLRLNKQQRIERLLRFRR